MNVDSRKIKMEINIAGEHLKLSVPFDEQNLVRDTEHEAGALYDSWRRRFPHKKVAEILAMMVYQYASRYHSVLDETEKLRLSLEKLNDLAESLTASSNKSDDSDQDLTDLRALTDPDSAL